MENNPKKSKALIVTIIVIILLLIFGYLIFKNGNFFGIESSSGISKIFSSLNPSDNSKKIIAEAGEDLKNGDSISVSGTNENNIPIVVKDDNSDYGFTNQDIAYGELGEITINSGGTNTFWSSFSDFLGDIIKKNPNKCLNGATNYPTCDEDIKICMNGATNPPDCDDILNSCLNGATNYPTCDEDIKICMNGATNPPSCDNSSNICLNGADDYPACDNITYGQCLNGATNYPTCDEDIKICMNGATNPPSCDNSSNICLNGATNPPICNSTNDVCINGADNPPMCSNLNQCLPGFTGVYPDCVGSTTCPDGSTGTYPLCNGDGYCLPGFTGIYPNCIGPETCPDGYTGIYPQCVGPTACPDGYIGTYPYCTPASDGYPDLMAGMITPTSTPINTLATLTSIISNTGGGPTEKSFSTFFTVTNTTTNKEEELNTMVPSIEEGGEGIAIVKYTFATAGTYTIRACADKNSPSDEGIVTESNENNNCGYPTTLTATDSLPPVGTPECSDKIDNEGDGKIDVNDENCHVGGDINGEYLPEYDSESTLSTECNDTTDNDKDGGIDKNDPECHAGGDIKGEFLPLYDSETNTSTECNDTIDNDGDKLIDDKDPECHVGGVIGGLYTPTNNSETNPPIEPDVCLDIDKHPLVFTDAEKAKLAELLRKFYLIAPTLKTEDDIVMIYQEIDNYNSFIGNLNELTKQCYLQTNDSLGYIEFCEMNPGWCNQSEDLFTNTYTGPTTKYGNPWYKYSSRGSYVGNVPIENGFCYGPGDGHGGPYPCPVFQTKLSCEIGDPFGKSYATKCKWVDKTNLKEYETLLNIW